MSAKHKLKGLLREVWARLLFHTGFHALVNRLQPRRLTILFGHCVDDPGYEGFFSDDMVVPEERLERILRWFGARYELVTVGEGWRRLNSGGRGRSLVALSMDDGYRDNRHRLLPLLERSGARCTVFLESRPLDERRVNWLQKYFWSLGKISHLELAKRYLELSKDERACTQIRNVLEQQERLTYQLKRVLKYEAQIEDRDACLQTIFESLGGDERALCDKLYLTWQEVRELQAAGVEIGCHTVTHPILAKLTAQGQREEIEGCSASIARETGVRGGSLAYPFGRRWDYDTHSQQAAEQAGYTCAVITHAGTNRPRTPPFELRRLPIDRNVQLHLLVTEACGGFDLLRRVGLDLSE